MTTRKKHLLHIITAEVKLPNGDAFWGTYRVFGLKKLDKIAALEAEGSKIISIQHQKCIG